MNKLFYMLAILLLSHFIVIWQQAPADGANAQHKKEVNWKTVNWKPKSRGKTYIELKYPEFSDADDKPLTAANVALQKTISSALQNIFRDQISDYPLVSIDGQCEVRLANKQIISVLIMLSSMGEGAAHPNNYDTAFNFQIAPPAIITLESLFQPHSPYLKTLSKISLDQIVRSKKAGGADRASIQSGCAPATQNFRTFLILDKGIEIDFGNADFASYAEGDCTVMIPYSKIKSLLDSNSIVYKLANRIE